jgi:superfamily II DNA helicase RecQ
VVFHDRTLAAIAAARPGDAGQLGAVKGVGPAKLAAYGDAVLALVRAPLD